MQDPPRAQTILGLVAAFLREPQSSGNQTFHLRVAANAIELAVRELEFDASAAETLRLSALLGEAGDLIQLNDELCRRIRSGALGLENPALVSHLKATILEKLSVDQPNYPAYIRSRNTWGCSTDELPSPSD